MSAARPDTWMPLYIGDYLADTMHLTAELHGAYLLLIMACWRRNGILPPEEQQLAAIARLTIARWRALLSQIAPFFLIGDDGWRHKRVTKELAEAQRLIDRGKAAGQASAQQRANKTATSSPTRSQQEAQQNGNPLPSPSPRKKDSEAIASAAPRPLDLKKAFWETGRAFLEANGVPAPRAGPLLGKWRKDYGEPAVVEVLARADAACPSEIVEFIEGCLRTAHGRKPGKPTATESLYAGFALELGKREQQADRGAGGDAAEPLLDRGHGPETAPVAKRGLAG